MINKYFLVFIALIFSVGCNRKIFFSREFEDWESKPAPDPAGLKYSVYLVGDVGYPSNNELNLILLEKMIQEDSLSSTIFLGDNIYHDGMPPIGAPGREEAEAVINRLYQIVDEYKGKVFFIPGNHDWDNMGKEGWRRVLNQERYVEDLFKNENVFVPGNACPGPFRVSVSDELVVIFLDSQWWLHEYKKPYGTSSECDAATPYEVLIQLRDVIDRNKDRHLVVAAHHPLYTNGNHGGYYNALDHIFPLRLIRHRWYMYVPLPLLGSLYPLYRKFGGSSQDLPHYDYQVMKKEFMKIFKDYSNVIYVSGHDHNLQYFKIDEFHHIVSGSGCKVNPVRVGGNAAFVQKHAGFARLQFYENGEAWVEYFVPDKSSNTLKLSFRTQLYKKFEILPESYCTLSRLDYSDSTVVVSASEQYKAGKTRKFFLGEHYRNLWTVPVEVPILDLQTEKGGIIPYSLGGGKQSVTLKFKNPEGQEYVARSINKDPEIGVVPVEFLDTFVEDLVQDQISAQHPYGAVTVPPLANAARVLYPSPKIAYIPADSCLGPYFDEFANTLVMFEEDPDESHVDAPNLGFAKNIVGTDKLLEELRQDNDNEIDQYALLRTRLLDMLIGDWDRHQGQFRWAEFEKGEKGKLYVPVPEDRDQIYFKFDGLVPFIANRKWAARELRNFDDEFDDIIGLNQSAKFIDRRFLSELSREEWLAVADSMQMFITDSVIETAIRQLPPPVFELHGSEIIGKLKSRRAKLPEAAEEYYEILSKYVNVFGSDKHELFRVERISDDSTRVSVYKTKKGGEITKKLYDRVLSEDITREIRLYGLGGKDVFEISGKVKDGILVRIIGGDGKDSIISSSTVSGLRDYTIIYDTPDTYVIGNKEVNLKLSEDTEVNEVDEDQFFYNYTGPKLTFEYNQGDGFFLGGGILFRRYRFRANPYGSSHRMYASYASATSSWMFRYHGDIRKVFGKTDFAITSEAFLPYFAMNYFGYGNTSSEPERDIDFYRVRLKYGIINPSFVRRFTEFLMTGIGPKIEYYELVEREGSFVDEVSPATYFEPQYFVGLRGYFQLGNPDNYINPTRGIILSGEASANQELNLDNSFYSHFESSLRFYITPNFNKQLTIAGRIGAAANTGDFTFYQANEIGALSNLRGYYRTRFVGDKSFYQNLEVRAEIFKIRTYLIMGKFGLAAFIDNARVWPGGGSYHQGYGGGVWISFINRFVFSGYYGFSEEGGRTTFRLGFFY